MSNSSLKFLAKPKIRAHVSSGVGFAFISVPQTIIFLFFAALKSIDLFLKPLVMINFNLSKLSIKFLDIGVLSLIINNASNSASCSIVSASSMKGSLKILNSYFPDNFFKSTNFSETF